MVEKKDQNPCCESSKGFSCCKVESVVTIDSKGQLLLPKELRDQLSIQVGDKLVLVSMAGNKKSSSCLMLIKADYFADMVKNFLGPMVDDLFKK